MGDQENNPKAETVTTEESNKDEKVVTENQEQENTTTKEEGSAKSRKKKSKKKHVARGRVYIKATYNNTIVTFTDQYGNTLTQSSAGRCGFKGPKKSTSYAAGIIVRDAVERVKEIGLKDVDVFVKGIGSGREGAVRALNAHGFNIMSIKDITPIAHGGCRPKKARRV